MNTTNNKFSIIVCNFNGERYLEEAIQSCLNQNFSNKEIIVVDGKSTDKSHGILESFGDTIKWIKEKDKGISDAFNIGISFATGDYIMYLGNDDFFYNENVLLNVDSYITLLQDYCLLDVHDANFYASSINQSPNGESFLIDYKNEINLKNLISHGTPVGLQNIYFNATWIKTNLFDISNRYSMDYEIYFRMIIDGQKFIKLQGIVNTVNLQGDNISTKLAKRQSLEAILVAKKYSYNIYCSIQLVARYIKYMYHSLFTWK